MKILYIAPVTEINGKGGDSIHLQEITQHLAQTNDLILISPSKTHFNGQTVSNFLLINNWQIGVRILSPFLSWLSAFILGCIAVARTKPDIIYERHHICGVGCWIGKIFNIPCITEVNGLLTEEHLDSKRVGKFGAWLMKKIEKVVFSIASKIITVNVQITNYLVHKFNISPNKIIVIENGVNVELFRSRGVKRKEDKYIRKGYLHVGFIGSLSSWCGLDSLIKSVPFIMDKIKNVKFIVVGDGPKKHEFEALTKSLNLEKCFLFTGYVPHQEISRYLYDFDVGVALKKRDIPGSPLKLWEYMACGKPVVATNTQDFKTLKENEAGILVDPEKTEEVADAIITLLKNKELRETMGKNGRKYVVKNHSWRVVAKKVEKVCKQIIETSEK